MQWPMGTCIILMILASSLQGGHSSLPHLLKFSSGSREVTKVIIAIS